MLYSSVYSGSCIVIMISFLISDVPFIVSDQYLLIIDPHTNFICNMEKEESRTGERIRLRKASRKVDQLVPFENLFGFKSSEGTYNGTLFRFPFRRQSYARTYLRKGLKSKISDKIFTPQEAEEELFKTLLEETPYLLLFLKSVESVELYTWDTARECKSLFFKVSIADSCLSDVRKFRRTCMDCCQLARSTTVVTSCSVQLRSPTSEERLNWLLCSTVGSSDMGLLEQAKKLKVSPWSAVGAPLHPSVAVGCTIIDNLVTPQMNSGAIIQRLVQCFRNSARITEDWTTPSEQSTGYPFCFLPLKDPTGLPVQVHGYFRVSSNRRSIEWPSPGDTGEQAIWNKCLVETSLVPSYAILMAAKSLLLSYKSSSVGQPALADPYSWWPIEQDIRNSPVWRYVLEPTCLAPFLSGLNLFWTPNGGRWIKASDAVLIPTSIPKPIVDLLMSLGCSVVNVPPPIKKTFNSLNAPDSLTEVTPSFVRELLRARQPTVRIRDFDLNIAILEYITSDLSTDYSSLENLFVLPVADPSCAPVCFTRLYTYHNHMPAEKIYIVHSPNVYEILPNLKSKMISLKLPSRLIGILVKIAKTGMYTLVEATPEEVCPCLITESMKKWTRGETNKVQWTPGSYDMPEERWLQCLWKWMYDNSMPLELLRRLPIVPVQSVDVKLSPHSSVELVSLNSNLCLRRAAQSGTIPEEIYRIAVSLGYKLIDHSSIFTNHKEELEQFLPTVNPASLLNAMQQLPAQRIRVLLAPLPHRDKDAIRTYIFQAVSRPQGVWSYLKSFVSTPQNLQLSPKLLEFFKSLPLFAIGVGASPVSYISLSDQLIFPADDVEHFPSHIQFPPNVLRVSPSDRECYNTLLETSPESRSQFISCRFGPYALDPKYAMKTMAFIWILQQYRFSGDPDVKDFLCSTNFLPSTRQVFRRASQLYDPKDKKLKQMLFESQVDFPALEFHSFLPELREIGLLTWNSILGDTNKYEAFVLDRARAISDNSQQNYDGAKECSKIILESLLANGQNDAFLSDLREINFLVCEAHPPKNYPTELQWKGSRMPSFVKPASLCAGGTFDQMAHLVGSSCPLLDSEYSSIIAQLSRKTGSFKVFFKASKIGIICQHLTNITSLHRDVYQRHGAYITEMIETIYKYLDINSSKLVQQYLPSSIWHASQHVFVPLTNVVKKTDIEVSLAPHLYSLQLQDIPGALKYERLWDAMGMKTKPSPADCFQVLPAIQRDMADKLLSARQVTRVVHVLKHLLDKGYSGRVLLPTADGRLMDTAKCTFDDRNLSEGRQGLLSHRKDIVLTHKDITRTLAEYFKVPPLSSKIAKPRAFKIKSNIPFKGQEISLTRRISNIIKDYEDRIDVFKELIQNADDAGATEVKFLIDWRQHPTENLFTAKMRHWQGPALYAYNNRMFSDEDFEHICKVEGGTKLEDPAKIGRFGLGFCCTYQLTDVPSFVSRSQLVVFDPHLQYLGECASNQTGMMIDYVAERDDMVTFYKDQLAPFEGLFGCHVLSTSSGKNEGYPYTLFRFPFRTPSTPRSDICGNVFDESAACEWKASFKASAERLLVFLRHIEKVELYELNREGHVDAMKCICSVTSTIKEVSGFVDLVQEHKLSQSLTNASRYSHTKIKSMSTGRRGMKVKMISIQMPGGADSPKSKGSKGSKSAVPGDQKCFWMVSSVLGGKESLNLACTQYGRSNGLVPLAEVAVKMQKEGDLLVPVQCKGQVFCFLPLPIATDQKCLINGYFEVSPSRRNLLHLQARQLGMENEVHQWNRYLIQDALSEAFANVLLDIQSYNGAAGKLSDGFLQNYYSIWPILYSQDDISRELKSEFVQRQLLYPACQPLFYTQSGDWSSCTNVTFLSKSLRKHFSAVIDDTVKVLCEFGGKKVVLNVPDGTLCELVRQINVMNSIEYIKDILFHNLENIGENDRRARDTQLKLILKKFRALQNEDGHLTSIMRNHVCIPTDPNGTLRKPTDLIDSSRRGVADLYDVEEERFPHKELMKDKEVVQTLRYLGMVESTLKDEDVIDRATSVTALASQYGVERARSRSEKLQDYIVRQGDYLTPNVKKRLATISFLPVKQRPPGTSVPWCDDLDFGAPHKMHIPKNTELVFTTEAIADCKEQVHSILNFKDSPHVDDIISHLNALLKWQKSNVLTAKDKTFVSRCIQAAYNRLDTIIRPQSDQRYYASPSSTCIKSVREHLSSVWDENTFTFVSCGIVALESPVQVSLAPYRMTKNEIPALRKYNHLWEAMGISTKLSEIDYLAVLEEMAQSSEPLNKGMISGILQYLCGKLNDEQKRNLLLPTTQSVLVQCSSCYYDDRHWNERNEGSHLLKKYTFVDSRIVSEELARDFGVCPISSRIGNPERLQMKYEKKGQRIPVSRRINRILKEYKEVNDVFKELIQNADDAKATKVKFLIDWRQHSSESLFRPEMEGLQGPALYAYNNSVFSDNDFENICELEGATKKEDATKIGRFGLGFCATYHLTDVPSFASRGKVVFLDPQLRYLGRAASEASPGVRFNFIQEREEINGFYHDQMVPFQGIFECNILGSTTEYDGTLFRFPFRTAAQKNSGICQKVFDEGRINAMKETFEKSADLLPVFLQHVKSIELWELHKNAKDPTKMKLLMSVERDTPRSFQPLQVFNTGKSSGSLPQYTSTEQFYIVSKKLSAKVSPGPVKKSNSKKKAKKHVNPSYNEHTTQWIVSSALARPGSQAWNYACSKAHKGHGLVPLTEVAISTKEQSVIPDLQSKGHVYCFLPLPIVIDDLSCKINGCFAVPSNRRTLEDLENEDRNTWNHLLIKEVLVDAYLNLLCYLATKMPTNKETWKMCLDTYYKLWPMVRLSHPLSKELREGFLTALKTCSLPLVSGPIERGKWLVVSEVSVLEDCFYGKTLGDIKDSIEKVLIDRDYKMGDFPSNVRRSLSSKSNGIVATLSFKTYCHHILLSDWDTGDAELRNEQLFHVLKHFKALNEDHDWLKDLLMTSQCIPSKPNGTRCKPTTLICPEGMLEGLYSVEEERFPRAEFLQNDDIKDTLVHLGMSHHLLCHGDVLERAQTIETLPQHEAKERCETFIKYLTSVHYLRVKHASTHSMASKHDDLLDKLSRVPFLPVQQRPEGTTLPWFSDNHCFAAPQCLFRSRYSNVAFTQGCIVAEWTGKEVQDLLSLKFPQDTVVVGHFEAITAWADQQQVSAADAMVLNEAMPTEYKYLCKQLQPEEMYLSAIGKSEDGTKTLEARLLKLCTQPCVWQTVGRSGKFLTPTQVVSGHNKTDYYPYLVKLSVENMKYLPLFKVLGVKKEFSLKQLVQVLQSIDMHNSPFPDTLISFIVDVSHLICRHHPNEKYRHGIHSKPKEKYREEWNNLKIYLPSEDCVMTLSSELAHREDVESSEFLPPDLCEGRTQYVHPRIPKRDAKLLGVADVLSSIMRQFEDNDFLTEVEFGQREELHTRLNNILSQYPSDVSIFKEFIQNAEDATASEIAFVIDRHAFEDKSLFADHDSWKSLQKMPALLVFNNRKFKEKDIESIKELGVGGKGESLDKIGRFGIGFNVAYHITDCPMFVSYGEGGQAENFCAFDPNFHYVPKAGHRKQPGARYIMKNKDGKNSSEHFKDQFLPFLGGDIIPKMASAVEGCFEDSTSKWPSGYSVFRLPLTRYRAHTQDFSTNLNKGHPMNVEDLQTHLEDLKIQAPSMLLFLSHLKRISVFEISETGQIVSPWSVSVSHTEDGARTCAEFAQSVHKLCSQICNKEGLTTIPPSVSVNYKIELKVFNSVQEVPVTPPASRYVASTHSSSVRELPTKFSEHTRVRGIPSSKPKAPVPPKQWVVCKRFGVADVPKELLYLAGDNHLFPLAGVAVPLPGHQSFIGQLFTHLPLPLRSGVPAHVNAHFWVDQSRKHLENSGSGKTEPLKNWNETLSKHVVSQTYIEALLKCRKFVSKDEETSVDWFYKLIILCELGESIPPSLNDFHFKEVIHQLLLEKKAQVLLADGLKHTGKSPNWLTLTTNQSNPKKGWFFSGQESVKEVLLSLGVQITVAPMSVNHAVKCRRPVPPNETAKPDYSGEVTPELARKYLKQRRPPSCVEENVIIPALVPLLTYILSDISSPEECSKVNGLPLMLTSNGRLQDINTSAPLFRREFAHLLPEGVAEYFISEKLMKDIHLEMKLIILQLVQHVTPQFVARHTELVKLPIVNFSESNVKLVINLWHYIDFICKGKLDCFKEFAIIPTNQSTLVSVGMSKSILREYGSVHLLKKLGLPVVDFMKFADCADKEFIAKCNEAVRPLLAVESEPDQVLHVIQTAKVHGYLCPCADIIAIDAYGFIGFVVKSQKLNKYKSILKGLSIYETVTGDWQPLEEGSRVYALPQSSVPQDGLKAIHSSQCFIIHIQHLYADYYRAVGVEVLLEPEFYQKVIIPNFCSLSTEAMIIHLQRMSTIMASDCNVLLKQTSEKCFIWDERKNQYCSVTEYHDPEEPLLKTFLPEDHFPPQPWSEKLSLLKSLGLRSTVTDKQWIQFARSVTTLPKHEALQKSKVLLSSLQSRLAHVFSLQQYSFHKQVQKDENQQSLKLFLDSIADIQFVPQTFPLEIDLLFHQLKGHSYSTPEVRFVPLRNSFLCEPDEVPLVCFDSNRPYVQVEEVAGLYIRKANKEFILRSLGMKLPTDRDVCRNLLEWSSIIAGHTLSSKQSADVTKRLQSLFASHYDFLRSSDLRTLKSELNEKKCLFLPSEDGATFTICRGKDLVQNHKTSRPYRIYIPCVPLYLRDTRYSSFLLEVGVTPQITAKHFVQLLEEFFAKGNLFDPNFKECVVAVYEDLVKELRSPRSSEAIECVDSYPFIPLPDENIVLHASNELVLNDAEWIKNRLMDCSDYHFIRPPPPLPVGGEVTLPACLKVQTLSTLIYEELDEAAVLDRENRCVADLRAELTQTDDEEAEVQVCPHAGPFVHFLQSEEFGNGLRRLISDRFDGKPLTREHENCIQEVQELQVKCVYAIRTVLKNSKTGDIIPGSENSDVPCYLDDKSNPKCLYVQFHPQRAELEISNGLLLVEVVQRLMRLLKDLVDALHLQCLLNSCDPERVSAILDKMHVKPYTPQEDSADGYSAEGEEGKGTTIENFEYIVTCNFREDELVKYCKADSETVVARVIKVERSSSSCEYPYPTTVHVKASVDDDPEVKQMNSLLVCKFLPPSEEVQLRKLYGSQSETNPSDLSEEKSIVLELPCSDVQHLRDYLSIVVQTVVDSYSNEQVYFSIERLLFQLHFDSVHRHKQPELFLRSLDIFLTVVDAALMPRETYSMFLDSLHTNAQTMRSKIEPRHLQEEDSEDDQELSVDYSQMSSWSVPQQPVEEAPSSGQNVQHGISSTYQGAPVLAHAPLGPIQRQRRRGGRRSNYPLHPGPASMPGGGSYIWSSGPPSARGQVWPSPIAQVRPEPPPRVSKEDARVWLRDIRETVAVVNHLREEMIQADILGQDGEIERRDVFAFPAAICFYAHEIVLKCLKALFFAYCGLPGQLVECSNLVELHQRLLAHEETPQEVRALEPFVHLVSGHGSTCCCYSSFDPPTTANDRHSPIVAREVLAAAMDFLTGILRMPVIESYYSHVPANQHLQQEAEQGMMLVHINIGK